MANLNLSQFGENSSVSDADYTFVWDSANAISKKVSRNSWLNSGTLTSDAPVTISQTWGTTGTYTAFKVVANETAVANTLSNVLELWSGNAATLKLSIRKSGQIVGPSGTIAAPTYGFADTDWGTGFSGWYRLGTGVACSTAGGTISAFSITHTNIRIGSSIPFGWTSGTAENALDTILLRDGAANTLALRNGINPQTFNVYGTWTTAITNFERLAIKYNTTDVAYQIAAEKGTTNGDYRPLQLWTGGASRLHITTAGNVGIGTINPTSNLQIAQLTAGVGTISVGAAGTTVTGVGTQFLNTFAVGQTITSAGQTLTISAIASDTSMTTNAAGAAISGQPYTLVGGTRMSVLGNGNVGIGTTSPTSKLDVAGAVTAAGYYYATSGGVSLVANGLWQQGTGHLTLASGAILGWSGAANVNTDQPGDTRLLRDEAYHLALRNGTNGQKFSVYGTYPGAAWERFTITAPTSGNVLLGTYQGTGGIARGLEFQTAGVTRMTLANTEITASVPFTVSGLGKFVGVQLGTSGSSRLVSPGYGIATFLDSDGTGNFTKLNLAGNTDSFPALKRSTTRIQAVLATTDTTFTNIQGKLTTDTAFDATVVTPTGFITLYDSTGAAYKVPCVPA